MLEDIVKIATVNGVLLKHSQVIVKKYYGFLCKTFIYVKHKDHMEPQAYQLEPSSGLTFVGPDLGPSWFENLANYSKSASRQKWVNTNHA